MSVEANTIKAVFLAALEKTAPAERAAYLDEACAGDSTLRQRVEELLQAHARPDPLLDQPATEQLGFCEGPTALDALEPSDKPGSLGRLGHYEVLEIVGQGGMGAVLRAFDDKLHRVVAIKILAPVLAGSSAARQRFVREARAAAAVTHDNVISIHAVEDGGPVPFLVMQFVSGRTLQQKIDQTGRLLLTEILRIGLQIAEGLAAAHRQGLIHRDIKPANILLENGIERVKITDFGLARAADDASLTRSGIIAGTPAYMSPEQANGEHVDYRTDLFSLGSVLYTMCAGHPPFRAASAMAVLKRVCEDTPRPVREINSEVPDWLDEIIARLLAKAPAKRFATAAEVATLLSRCLAQLQTGADPAELTIPAVRQIKDELQSSPRRRRPAGFRHWIALGALAVAVAGGGWFVQNQWLAERTDAPGGQPVPPGANGNEGPAQPVVLKPSRTLLQHLASVRSLAISADGTLLASGDFDWHIYLWNTRTWEVRGPLEGHSGEVSGLDFSPDGKNLASVTPGKGNSLIHVWDAASGKEVATLGAEGDGMWAVAYSPDGQTIACGGWGKALHLLDVATGTERLVIPDVTTRHLRSLSFSPDGRQIATGGSGQARLWDTDSGEEIPLQVKLPMDMNPTILPDGKRVAGWVFSKGRVVLCGLPSGQMQASWQAHDIRIEGLAVSPDGRFLATIGGDGLARVWSTTDFTEIATLIGHQGRIYAAVFSPDGTRLITAGEDRTVRIWDLPLICHVAK